MLADLVFTFDPVLRLSDTATVRLETIALALVVFVGLLLAARIGSVTPATGPVRLPEGYPKARGLRVDDLVFICVGAVPGAVFGGRLGYVLDNLDFYQANPNAILDPAQGGLSLSLAVPLGIFTAGIIARLLDAHVGRWMHAAALPMLVILGGGKLVGVLGASGQGAPSTLDWATSYAGPGPWGSLAAGLPSHPSQVYEAILVGAALLLTVFFSRFGVGARRDGAAMFYALGFWAVARFISAFTWRDPLVAGPLNTEQLLLIAVMVVALVGLLERVRAPLAALPDLPLTLVPEAVAIEPPLAAEGSIEVDQPLIAERSIDVEPAIASEPPIEIDAPQVVEPSLDAEAAAEAESLAAAEAAAELAMPEAGIADPDAPNEPVDTAIPSAPGDADGNTRYRGPRKRATAEDSPP